MDGACACREGYTGVECDYQPKILTRNDYYNLKNVVCDYVNEGIDDVEKGHRVGGFMRIVVTYKNTSIQTYLWFSEIIYIPPYTHYFKI